MLVFLFFVFCAKNVFCRKVFALVDVRRTPTVYTILGFGTTACFLCIFGKKVKNVFPKSFFCAGSVNFVCHTIVVPLMSSYLHFLFAGKGCSVTPFLWVSTFASFFPCSIMCYLCTFHSVARYMINCFAKNSLHCSDHIYMLQIKWMITI